jgi:hypothetical protein
LKLGGDVVDALKIIRLDSLRTLELATPCTVNPDSIARTSDLGTFSQSDVSMVVSSTGVVSSPEVLAGSPCGALVLSPVQPTTRTATEARSTAIVVKRK